MASSYPEGQVGKEISETAAFVDKTRSELEERFGLLYMNGKHRVLDDTERQKMMGLYKMLEDMKGSIDKFQEDSLKVCGTDISGFQQRLDVEEREPKGRLHVDPEYSKISLQNFRRDFEEREPKGRLRVDQNPESGYKSEDLSSVYSTPSYIVSRHAAEMFDPSISCISTSGSAEQLTEKKEATSFYLETPATSASSLSNMAAPDCPSTGISNPNAEQDDVINFPAVQTVPKETNDLSKPPSEEDNTKYANVSTSSIH